jgi:hypothetical protein
MAATSELLKVGDAFAWIEDGKAIHLKASTGKSDPVELTAAEAMRVAEMLTKLARTLDSAQKP